MYPLFNNYRNAAIQSLPFSITPFLHDGLKRETKKILKATCFSPAWPKSNYQANEMACLELGGQTVKNLNRLERKFDVVLSPSPRGGR